MFLAKIREQYNITALRSHIKNGVKKMCNQISTKMAHVSWWPFFVRLITGLYTLYILAVFPLLYDRKRYSKITRAKFRFFWRGTSVFFALLLIIGIAHCIWVFTHKKNNPLCRLMPRKITVPQILVLLYMAWAGVSCIVSEYSLKITWIGSSRYEGLCSILLYGFAFILVSQAGRYRHVYSYAFAVSMVLFGVICLRQSFGEQLIYRGSQNYWNTLFLGTIGNIDMVAAVMALGVPLLGGLFVFGKSPWRFVCLPPIALLLYVQVFSDVDSSKIGIIAGVLSILPFMLDSKKHIARTCMLFSVCLFSICHSFQFHVMYNATDIISLHEETLPLLWQIGLALLFVSLWLTWLPETGKKVIPRWMIRGCLCLAEIVCVIIFIRKIKIYDGTEQLLCEIRDFLNRESQDWQGSNRIGIWRGVLEVIKWHPWVGGGPGTLCEEYRLYNELVNPGTKSNLDFAHNDFLQIAACEGYIGLGLYICFIIALIFKMYKNAEKKPAVLFLGAGCIGYLAHSFFSFSLAMVTPLFWVTAALLDGVTHTNKNE